MSTSEKLKSHYNSLKEKHDLLDKQIAEAYNTHTDNIEVNKMKHNKLHLKEQMYQIEQQLGNGSNGKTILYGNEK
jgi:uncharacterized protein YdcH (DUF465 family)